jgi:spermidine/putrescine transport system substrate-binding protein
MARHDQPAAGVSRRRFLFGSGALGAGVLLGGSSFLAACGGGDDDDSAGGATTTAGGSGTTAAGGGGGSLYFENWPEYIDAETVGIFKAETGVDLRYTEAFNDNNEYFAKIQPILGTGKTIDPDILAPSYWMAARFISLEWVEKLPFDQIPNAANLRDDLRNPTWDPTNEWTLPYQTGMTGIAYNLGATGRELKSVNDLFDPAFKGRIGMLTEMRDTIGLILLAEGKDPATITTYDEAASAFDKLEQAKNDGQIRQFTGNDYVDDLATGNFAANIAWSGDVLQLSKDNPDVRFVFPEEGAMSWADTMVLMKGSPNAANAATWMNFIYDPVNAARITADIQFVSPVKGVREELTKLGGEGAELAESPLLFPDEATAAKLAFFASLSEEEEAKFDERFSEIIGA